jgi:hypothetical protein
MTDPEHIGTIVEGVVEKMGKITVTDSGYEDERCVMELQDRGIEIRVDQLMSNDDEDWSRVQSTFVTTEAFLEMAEKVGETEVKRLREQMFLIGKCEGDREGFDYDECCGRICPWLENSHCAIDGWEPPE